MSRRVWHPLTPGRERVCCPPTYSLAGGGPRRRDARMRLSRAVTHFKSNPDSQRRGPFVFPSYLRAAGTLSLARAGTPENSCSTVSATAVHPRARGTNSGSPTDGGSTKLTPARAWAHRCVYRQYTHPLPFHPRARGTHSGATVGSSTVFPSPARAWDAQGSQKSDEPIKLFTRARMGAPRS